jgi:hypothetical protein
LRMSSNSDDELVNGVIMTLKTQYCCLPCHN